MKITKIVALLTLILISTLNASEVKLPDIEKAFPNEKLLNKTNLGNIQAYSYPTNKKYDDLKAQLKKYLGSNWEEDTENKENKSIKEMMESNDVKMLGHDTFYYKNNRKISIIISQVSADMGNTKYLLSIVLHKE